MEDVKNKIVTILMNVVIMNKRLIELDDFIGGDAFLEMMGHELDELEETAIDMCGVPKEGTPFALLGINTTGYLESQIEYGFCRDNIKDVIFSYSDLEYEDIPLACDVYVIALLDEWLPDYETIYENLP